MRIYEDQPPIIQSKRIPFCRALVALLLAVLLEGTHEGGLVLGGLEPSVAELGAGVDELEVDLLKSPLQVRPRKVPDPPGQGRLHGSPQEGPQGVGRPKLYKMGSSYQLYYWRLILINPHGPPGSENTFAICGSLLLLPYSP